MNVLVACEQSQTVCQAFRKRGHYAYSCDIQDCSGGHPEWHIQGDVLPLLNGKCEFWTKDKDGRGVGWHYVDKWDLIIAHPPCTYLTLSGNRWYNVDRYGDKALLRFRHREKAVEFFNSFVYATCQRICIENPIGVMSTFYRKPDQIIQPYQFALSEEECTVKSTCLWLKNLPLLDPIYTKKPDIKYHYWFDKNGKVKRQSLWYYNTRCLPHSQRALFASKTFPGIAQAMADQWG